MKRSRGQFKLFFAIITLSLMAGIWWLFAPTQFGGQSAYVIVTGNSMEPGFHRGDLVIIHQAADYQVGDIVTYRHPEIGPIIHRIVERQGEQFIFKGDNNAWLDSYRPTQAEFIGKFWLYVPYAGKIIQKLREPWPMALLAAVMGLLLVGSITTHSQPQARRLRRSAPAKGPSRPMSYLTRNKADFFFVLAVLALASFLLAIFTFNQPLTRTLFTDLTYHQNGQFSYSAAAPPGLYGSDTVETGQPVFRRLINQINLNFNYQFSADPPHQLSGDYRLLAELSHRNGWKWLLELQPQTAFSGDTFTASGQLDLTQVQTLIESLEQQTGLPPQPYTLAIIPTVTLSGTLDNLPLRDTFAPRLAFQLDGVQLQLNLDSGGPAEAANLLNPAQTGQLKRPEEVANTLALLGLSLEVATVRRVAVIGLTLSLAGLLALGSLLWRAAPSGPADRIEQQYGPLLITVRGGTHLAANQPVIEVSTLEDLAKIAERDGCMLLRQEHAGDYHYFVMSHGLTYRYQPEAPAAEEAL